MLSGSVGTELKLCPPTLAPPPRPGTALTATVMVARGRMAESWRWWTRLKPCPYICQCAEEAGDMKALDYAIRTENWELAALCLVVGAMEALEMMPPDSVDELLSELDVDLEECAPRRHRRLKGEARGG